MVLTLDHSSSTCLGLIHEPELGCLHFALISLAVQEAALAEKRLL